MWDFDYKLTNYTFNKKKTNTLKFTSLARYLKEKTTIEGLSEIIVGEIKL